MVHNISNDASRVLFPTHLIDLDECQSEPCHNGGTCLDREAGFECLCKPGWEGIFCEKDTNECLSQPCMHDSTCVNLPEGYVCRCDEGWTGKACDLSQWRVYYNSFGLCSIDKDNSFEIYNINL